MSLGAPRRPTPRDPIAELSPPPAPRTTPHAEQVPAIDKTKGAAAHPGGGSTIEMQVLGIHNAKDEPGLSNPH